ncbi:hypothetical protein FA15DRAFT_759976 [Coprinopsis marcescibilis]|uniref:TEA domain-containing protein n=1 Tax=Coprinopsis marcescibilis TaxID=230819 RepID=A0A5C3KI79_COPMA|nr:hypothetical protein FA15DRAFT_759976 [Coprinopsis marcescibilis]
MDPAEWITGASYSSKGSTAPQHTFVSMSTVEDLSYTPSPDQRQVDAAHVAATGRRSWKTLKGKPEAVWPPALESALIEALEECQKSEARPTDSTGKRSVRYPRNIYISEYIFEKTGKHRTPKQVGSRLQQLRDTCVDERLSRLLRKPTLSLDKESPPAEEAGVALYMQIAIPTPRGPRIQFMSNDINSPHSLFLCPLTNREKCFNSSRFGVLSMFSNVVEVCSPWPLAREATWSVYKDSTLIHKEESGLRATPASSGYVYACELVPGFWSRLCEAEDPNHITIVQVLQPASSFPSAVSTPGTVVSLRQRELSIVYHFNIPDSQRSPESASTNGLGHSNPYPSDQPASGFDTPSMYSGQLSIGQQSSTPSYWTPAPGHHHSYERQGADEFQFGGTLPVPHLPYMSMNVNPTYDHSPQLADQNTWGSGYTVDGYAAYQDTGVVHPGPLSYESTPWAAQWGG